MELELLRSYFEAPELSFDEWAELRRAKVTASNFSKVANGVDTQGAQTYLEGLAGESIGVVDDDPYQSPAMITGSIEELVAMQDYLFNHATGEVLYGSKIFIPLGEHAGVSPDGLEITETQRIYLEAKRPSSPSRLVSLLRCKTTADLKKRRADVYWQCVMNMLVMNCDLAKVIVRHPKTGLHIIVVDRIETDIDKCSKGIENAVEEKLRIVQEINSTID